MDTCLKLTTYMSISYLIKRSGALDGCFVELSTHTRWSHLLWSKDKTSYFTQFRCIRDPGFLSHQGCYFVDIASILYTLSHSMQADWFHCLLTLVLNWQSYQVMVHLPWLVISLWLFCLLLLDVKYSCISHYSKSKTKQIDIAIIIRNQEYQEVHLETKYLLLTKKIQLWWAQNMFCQKYKSNVFHIHPLHNFHTQSIQWPKYHLNL